MSVRHCPLPLLIALLLTLSSPLLAQAPDPSAFEEDGDVSASADSGLDTFDSGPDLLPASDELPAADVGTVPAEEAPVDAVPSMELAAVDSSRAAGVGEAAGSAAPPTGNPFTNFFGGLRERAGDAAESLGGAASWAGDAARRAIAGDPVTLTQEERTNLLNMRPVLVEMAGSDGLFNRADRPDIMSSLGCDIASRVDAGIRAESRNRRLLGKIVIAVGRPGIESREQDKAYNQVYSGLEQFFDGAGIEGEDGRGTGQRRNVSTYALEDGFTRGARTLEAIDARRNGNVKVAFPRGFGVADLDSIIADPNRRPPNGVVKLKPARSEERVLRTCR